VWLDRRLRDGWLAVPFLVGEDVQLVDPYDAVLTEPGSAFLMPHGLDLPQLWRDLDGGLTVRFRPGPLERGDLVADPSRLYVAAAAARESRAAPMATFANGLHLVRADARPEDGAWVVRTVWRATRPLARDATLFVQLLSAGHVVGAVDAAPGHGSLITVAEADEVAAPPPLLPTSLWPPGLEVEDTRVLPAPRLDVANTQALPAPGTAEDDVRIVAGLYEWPSTDRIAVTIAGSVGSSDVVELWPGAAASSDVIELWPGLATSSDVIELWPRVATARESSLGAAGVRPGRRPSGSSPVEALR
jgi:hypothetical protein